MALEVVYCWEMKGSGEETSGRWAENKQGEMQWPEHLGLQGAKGQGKYSGSSPCEVGEEANLSFSREAFSHRPAPDTGERTCLLRDSVMSAEMTRRQKNAEGHQSRQETPGPCTWTLRTRHCAVVSTMRSSEPRPQKALNTAGWLAEEVDFKCRDSFPPSQTYSFIQFNKYLLSPFFAQGILLDVDDTAVSQTGKTPWPRETYTSMFGRHNSQLVCHISTVIRAVQTKNHQSHR